MKKLEWLFELYTEEELRYYDDIWDLNYLRIIPNLFLENRVIINLKYLIEITQDKENVFILLVYCPNTFMNLDKNQFIERIKKIKNELNENWFEIIMDQVVNYNESKPIFEVMGYSDTYWDNYDLSLDE